MTLRVKLTSTGSMCCVSYKERQILKISFPVLSFSSGGHLCSITVPNFTQGLSPVHNLPRKKQPKKQKICEVFVCVCVRVWIRGQSHERDEKVLRQLAWCHPSFNSTKKLKVFWITICCYNSWGIIHRIKTDHTGIAYTQLLLAL